jgi:C-methyltransferase
MELMQLACAPFLTGALTVAARAGIADLLHGGPRTVEELAAATGLQAAVLLRILRVLSSVQIFQRLDDLRFENNDASERLRDDHPASMRHFCILAGTEYYRAFGDIMHTAQTVESAFRHIYGGSIYSYMDENLEAGRIYDRAMEDLTAPVGRHLAAAYGFGAVHSVADIGGGSGVLLKEILRSNRALHATCFDRKDVCERGRQRATDSAENGLAGRLTFVAGDFFANVPAGHDTYILKNVLHNWSDESSVKILNVVRAAMKPQARLLVVEPLIEDDSVSTLELVNDLLQMVVCERGTTARTQKQMRHLLGLAGLTPLDVIPLPTRHQVMICALQTATT